MKPIAKAVGFFVLIRETLFGMEGVRMKSKRLIGLLCAAILTVNSAAQPTYAAAHSCGILQEPGSEEDFEEMDYEVLKTDEKGRQLLVRIGDVYVTSEYNDENKSSVTYY